MRQDRASSRQRFTRFERRDEPADNPNPAARGRTARPAAGTREPSLRRALRRLDGALSSGQLGRYLASVRPHTRDLVQIIVLSLLGIGIDMVWPLASAYLIDRVILNATLSPDEKIERIVTTAAGMVVLFAAGSALGWVRSLRLQLSSSRLSFDLRSQLFQRVLRLPLSELNEMTTGGVLSRLSSDVDNTAGLLQQALLSPLLAGVRLLVTLGIIFTLNAQIAAAVLLVIPPVMLLQFVYSRRLRPIWRSLGQDRQEIDGRVSEGLGGVRVVRSFRREKLEELAYTVGHHTVIRKQLYAIRMQRRIATIWELIMPLASLMIVSLGGYLVIMGQATIGVLVAFQAYIWRVLNPIMEIATSISGTQRGLAAMDRVFELLDKPEEEQDVLGALPAPRRVESIELDHVSFAYRAGQPVLSDVSLTVRGGTSVALVGPSGAGKTTLTDLLARFHDPTSGVIRLNGIDLREFQLRSYRSLIGVVSQDVFLFDGSIYDNIAYGRHGASHADVIAAAQRSNATEFIERLPEGYASLIGERGVKLSGGQRQRLSIARALLADPQILILDEATSSLDTESEQLIQESLRELLAERTTFVIAHRLSTIADASTIVVMEQGRAIEIGSHAELLRAGGAYSTMVQRQGRRSAQPSAGPQLRRVPDAE